MGEVVQKSQISADCRHLNVKYALILILSISGCAVYSPQMVDIPLINNKNEVRLDAGISNNEFLHATISAGITNKIALQAYINLSIGGRYFGQAAAGYFKEFGTRNVIEVYGGIGTGYSHYYKDPVPATLKGNYQLYFTQVNLGKIDCRIANADFGIGIKAGYLHSDITDVNYFTRNLYGPYETFTNKTIVIEPGAFIRFGGRKLKASLKVGSLWSHQFTNRDKVLPFNKLNIGAGINYRF